MPLKNRLTVTVFYYDTDVAPSNQPQEIAGRCWAEVMWLGEQLTIISEQLNRSLTQKEIENVIRLCHFHYENLLFRIYALRERAWDVVAALTGIPRKRTGNKQFRADVLAEVKVAYPNLSNAFQTMLNLIDLDVELRNVATHKTILDLGLMQEGVEHIWEFDSVLEEFDPQSEDGIRMRKLVRRSIKEFAIQQKQHIRDVFKAVSEFSNQCDAAIHEKRW